jgi:predicted nucleic acid-binding protein
MIVVADASPLRYLILIDAAEILRALYGKVLTSPEVVDELSQARTPEIVRLWTVSRPDWLEVRVSSRSHTGFPALLGAGERAAIALAEELHADALLIDDRAGRREAERRSVPTQGTLGVIDLAARHGLLDLPVAIGRLRKTNFRVEERLYQVMLDRDSARRHG